MIMENKHYRNNLEWKTKFTKFLNLIFTVYNIDYKCFCDKYHYSSSTVRYWFCGRNLPQQSAFLELKDFLNNEITPENYHGNYIFNASKSIFSTNDNLNLFQHLKSQYPDEKNFVLECLFVLYNYSKNKFILSENPEGTVDSTGTTQAVIFDFDGTLTHGKTNKTTWEQIWTSLGYDVKICQSLHLRYDRREITHSQWCKLTAEKFCDHQLHKSTLEKIAKSIDLIDGIEETFKKLAEKDIKIYIVSGSILYIIKYVLGDLYKYVDETKANMFKFDKKGFLTEIVGTQYDFEGKATFISKIAHELNISPKDILFVGNSSNDRFAYRSGARTLCINPILTDITNQIVWNDCIFSCNNLQDIIEFIK